MEMPEQLCRIKSKHYGIHECGWHRELKGWMLELLAKAG